MNNYSYNSTAKFLHWVIGILIIGNFIGGLTLSKNIFFIHIQSGLLILALVLLRIFWRLVSRYPQKIKTSQFEVILASVVQFLLYILMIVVPLMGIFLVQSKGRVLNFFGLWQIPSFITVQPKDISHQIKELHEYLAYSIIGLVVLHILGALKNHVINRNRVLIRMLPNFIIKKVDDF